jgi:membrane-associated protease RseP (regulator of RpoE activity)
MQRTGFFTLAGRGVLLVGGVAVMATSLALAQIGSQTQAQTRVPKQAGSAPSAAESPREPVERTPARQPSARQPNERSGEERAASRERRAPASLGLKVAGEGDAGLTVSSVEPDSLAAQAGLQANDRIVSIEGHPVRNSRALIAYLNGQDGRQVPIVIERDGRQHTIELTTTAASADGPWLGVFLEQGEDGERGAKVTQVYPAGPAARAGVRRGDVVVAVNGADVQSASDLIDAIDQLKAGGKAELTVLRGENQVKLVANLMPRSSFIVTGPRHLEPGAEEQWAVDHNHDDFYDIPEYAMEVEAHRRLAEQHERIENLIQQLRTEVQALREEIKARR